MNYRKITYGILAYYWILIGMFTMNLPTILPDNAVSFLTAGCVGWLWRDHSQRDSDIATARSRSPRLLTLFGDFSWDGVTDVINIDGIKCNLYYGNGFNYDGWFQRGNVAIVAPCDQVVEVGPNRLIKTKLDKKRMVPQIEDRIGDVRVILTGLLEHDIFGVSPTSDQIDLERQRDIALNLASHQSDLIDQLNKIVGDTAQIGQMVNPDAALRNELRAILDESNGDDE